MTTRFIQAPEAFVVTGIGTSETQITLSNFKTISGDTITQSMIGGVSDYVAMTLSPKTDREEQVWAKVGSVSGSNVILDIIRAVNPVSPYNNGGGIARPHNVNDTAVISNNPALFNKLTAKDNNEVVAGDWTFSGDNTHNGEETFTDTVDVTVGLLKVAPAVADDEPYTKLQSDTALALKASANATVNLTGNQTVAGIKTFSSAPIVPTAVNPTEAVNKSQMEAFVSTNSGDILASDSAFGTTKLDVAADVPVDPKALTATANRVAALAGGGDFGTPSGDNKFLTEEITEGTGKVQRASQFNMFGNVKFGTTTRSVTGSGATVNIAHGLGVSPKLVLIRAVVGTTTNASQALSSQNHGIWTPDGQTCIAITNSTSSSASLNSATTISRDGYVVYIHQHDNTAGNYQRAVLTTNATNLTFTWTYSGASGGLPAGNIQILWEAHA